MGKANIINDAGDCSVKRFMDCAFKEKYDVLLVEGIADPLELKNAFEFIYAQYIDLAGLYETREFELYAYITMLEGRINTVKQFIALQRSFVAQFDVPYFKAFGIVRKYGHVLKFSPGQTSTELFLTRLNQIEMMERRIEDERAGKVKQLYDLHKKKIGKQHSIIESRTEFVSMLNRLQQNKFVIDREKTSVEEIGLMIRDCKEQAMEQRMNNKVKRY